MSWGIKLEGTVDLDFLREPPGKQTMRIIGEQAISRIIVETQDLGKDKNNRRFRPYSKLYAEVRKAAGRSTRVDLTDTGHMINAISVTDARNNGVTVGFIDTVNPDRKSILAKAWPKLSESTKRSFYAIAAAAKRKAGKRPGTGPRRNRSATSGRRQGPLFSGHPQALPSEKARYTNRQRPWFGFGSKNSKRRQQISRRAINLLQEIFDQRRQRR
tara:strand:+ start:753 stop:1397 length:645 start_codon:yes stop_codon:yes gene_type:complete